MEAVSTTNIFMELITPVMIWIVSLAFITHVLNSRSYRPKLMPWWAFLHTLRRTPSNNGSLNAHIIRHFEYDPTLVMSTVPMWTAFMFKELGQYLSHQAAGAVCEMFFTNKSLLDYQVDYFFEFLLAYLKRNYSSASVRLLKRAQTAWPVLFPELLDRLVRSVAVPRQLLQEFAQESTVEERNELMKLVSRVTLTTERFIHHLQTINLLFLDSEKTVRLMGFIASNLQRHASSCTRNGDYGRLLLSLLENIRGTNVDQRMVWALIRHHHSEFRRACIAQMDAIESQQQEEERSSRFVRRPKEDMRSR